MKNEKGYLLWNNIVLFNNRQFLSCVLNAENGYEIIVNFVHNIYIAPSLLAIVAFTLLVTCFRVKKLPYIRFWIIPLILFINLLSAYLNYSKELIEIYSEVERALLFSLMTGIREISLILLVIIAYVKYYRLK